MKDQIKVLNLWADYFKGYLNETMQIKEKELEFSSIQTEPTNNINISKPQLFEIEEVIFSRKKRKNGAPKRNFISNLECLEARGVSSIEIRSL
ncbi:hypothetical protein CWI36_0774p0010 [Hamiltosporidium magnivora]|uniref:Uncharacterized protein n=1 Tax=Hamiltosporidium magnivora TaxID=148818 RepID=A0A4Q9L9E8_9MICR|nr:hypothetical protein CWI36_0774p0010 [Hamiltosporidium magnivora]